MFQDLFEQGSKIEISLDDLSSVFGNFNELSYSDREKKLWSGTDPYGRRVVLIPIPKEEGRKFVVVHDKFKVEKGRTQSILIVEGPSDIEGLFPGGFIVSCFGESMLDSMAEGKINSEVIQEMSRYYLDPDDYCIEAEKTLRKYGFKN
jgi:hypothetical protein